MSIDDSWRRLAKCAQEGWQFADIDLNKRNDVGNKQAEAERMCAGCKVISPCARTALRTGANGVVYAGVCIPDYCYNQSKSVTARLMYAEEYNAIPNAEQLSEYIDTHEIPKYAQLAYRYGQDQSYTPQVKVCSRGHTIEGDNVYTPPNRPGLQSCVKCIRIRKATELRNREKSKTV